MSVSKWDGLLTREWPFLSTDCKRTLSNKLRFRHLHLARWISGFQCFQIDSLIHMPNGLLGWFVVWFFFFFSKSCITEPSFLTEFHCATHWAGLCGNSLLNSVKYGIIPTLAWYALSCLHIFVSDITALYSLTFTKIWTDLGLALSPPYFFGFQNFCRSWYTIDLVPNFDTLFKGQPVWFYFPFN